MAQPLFIRSLALFFCLSLQLDLWADQSLDSIRIWRCIDSAWSLRNSAPDAAMKYAEKAAQLAEKAGDQSGLAYAWLRKAILLRNQENLEASLALMDEALAQAKAAGDKTAMASALANMSQIHRMQGDYEGAVRLSLSSIQYLEEARDTQRLLSSYNNLAHTYAISGNLQQATAYYERTLQFAVAKDDSNAISRAWYNLGVTYFQSEESELAEVYYTKALRHANSQKDSVNMARLDNSLGSLYFERGAMDTALACFQRAQTLYDAFDWSPERIMMYNNMASVHEQLGHVPKALSYYHRAAQLAIASELPNDLHIVYENLAGTHQELGNLDSALQYYRLHTALKDSLFSAEKSNQILELEEKYQSAKKDQSIAELNQVKVAQQADIKARNLWLGMAGLALLLLTIAGLSYRQRLKTQRALGMQEAELSEQRRLKLLQDQEVKALNAYLDGEAAERERIAQELHDRLGSQLTTVKLHYDHLAAQSADASQQQHMKKANELLGEACTEVRKIAHELATGVLRHEGLVAAIEQLGESISATAQLSVKTNLFALNQRLPMSTEVALFRSIQELIANTIRHADASEASIQLVMHEDHLNVLVADNGKGFHVSSASDTKGLGLASIKTRMEEVAGSFQIDSQPGHGTTVVLEVPLENPDKEHYHAVKTTTS